MNDSDHFAPIKQLRDLGRDEATRQLARAMRLRDFTQPWTARVGRTKLFLRDCDPALAADVAQRVQRFHQDFPHMAAKLREVNVLPLPHGCYAGTGGMTDGTFQISLNSTTYAHGQRSVMEERIADDYRNGFHRFYVAGGPFEHELGHVIDMSTGMLGSDSLDYADALRISGYAVHGGPEEAFADAFANYREGVSNGSRVDDLVARVIRAARTRERVAA